MVMQTKFFIYRAIFPCKKIKSAMQFFHAQIVGQFLCLPRVCKTVEGIIQHRIIYTRCL
jgi:hypothetical protein